MCFRKKECVKKHVYSGNKFNYRISKVIYDHLAVLHIYIGMLIKKFIYKSNNTLKY